MILKSINPYTNQVINKSEEYSDEKVDNALAGSSAAFKSGKLQLSNTGVP